MHLGCFSVHRQKYFLMQFSFVNQVMLQLWLLPLCIGINFSTLCDLAWQLLQQGPDKHWNITPVSTQAGKGSPDRKRALSTVNSSANLMWQKFFLLLRMAVMSPHCPKTSIMSCSVAFSGRPPTNTVLHPGGRSLVAGGGRSVQKKWNKRVCQQGRKEAEWWNWTHCSYAEVEQTTR